MIGTSTLEGTWMTGKWVDLLNYYWFWRISKVCHSARTGLFGKLNVGVSLQWTSCYRSLISGQLQDLGLGNRSGKLMLHIRWCISHCWGPINHAWHGKTYKGKDLNCAPDVFCVGKFREHSNCFYTATSLFNYGNCSSTWWDLNGTCPWTQLSFWSAET